MEFIVTNRNFELPAEISNLEELRQWLIPKLEFYKSLVVTEDGIKSAKAEKASLNKLKKVIDDKRKDIKKAYLEPYQIIEEECRKLIEMIDEPIKAIDSQIKAFDDMELQAKQSKLENHFNAENTLDFIAFDDVVNPKWRNRTEKTENLKSDMSEKIFKIKSDFDYLKNMYLDSGLWTAILRKFQETKSRELTISYAVELERSERRLNTHKTSSGEIDIITPETNQTPVKSDSDRRMISGMFKVTCTKSQLIALRNFMKEKSIEFEVVKEKNYA